MTLPHLPTADETEAQRDRDHERALEDERSKTQKKVAWISGSLLVVAALVTGVGAGFWAANRGGAGVAKAAGPDDVLSLSPIASRITGPTVPVGGTLKTDLPSGSQIFVASRIQNSEQDSGVLRAANVGFAPGPCDVDVERHSFDCGSINLGSAAERGIFYIYVGLADSSGARKITKLLLDQEVRSDYRHDAPSGYESLRAITLIRR